MKRQNGLTRYLTGLMLVLVFSAAGIHAQQSAQPSSSPAAKSPSTNATDLTAAGDDLGIYNVVSSLELGVRGLSVSGSDNKYRSDLNYRPGVRLFDSSFFLRSKEGTSGPFDELLVNSSGWGGDPHGYTRVSIEKSGTYRFDANVRRARYFNALQSIATAGSSVGVTGISMG